MSIRKVFKSMDLERTNFELRKKEKLMGGVWVNNGLKRHFIQFLNFNDI